MVSFDKNHDRARAAFVINRGHIDGLGRLNDKLRADGAVAG
jgi:hypothetical protein